MRIQKKLPPSHGDRNAKEHRRHGDCIIWRQMMNFAKTQDVVRLLVLVTRDVKENGWVEYKGKKIIGAHRNLVEEMRR